MYRHSTDATGEQLLGIQEAAAYLGMHRATLFRALSSGLIIPDHTTPKGRARFRLETVETFRESLRHQAASSHEHVYAPMRVMASLACLFAESPPGDDPAALLRESLQLICSSSGGFDMACVATLEPNETDPLALRMLAKHDFPDRLIATYQRLSPQVEFPVMQVLRSGVANFCDEIDHQAVQNKTTVRALADNGIVSYAAVPIVIGASTVRRIIGVLVVCGRAPHKYTRQEQVLLGGVADTLSACISHGSLNPKIIQDNTMIALTPEIALNVSSLLLEAAFSQARSSDAHAPPGVPVAPLCDLLVEKSYALATWVSGFSSEAYGSVSCLVEGDSTLEQYRDNLRTLVQRTSTADGLKREEWQSRVTAVALPVPLPSGARGAVGAVWRGVRREVKAEEIVLATLASACSLVSEYSSGR